MTEPIRVTTKVWGESRTGTLLSYTERTQGRVALQNVHIELDEPFTKTR